MALKSGEVVLDVLLCQLNLVNIGLFLINFTLEIILIANVS